MTATNIDRIRAVLTERGCNPKGSSTKFEARCPAHEDRNPSLSVKLSTDGKVLLHCHAGCAFAEITDALGIAQADTFPPNSNGKASDTKVLDATPTEVNRTEEYLYTDEHGEVLFRVCRYDEAGKRKTFRQHAVDPNGGWLTKLGDARRVLYRLPQVSAAAAGGEIIYFAEGEKDTDRLAAAGVVATTNPMGAGKWDDRYAESLKGAAEVRIVADRDKAGRDHAREIAASLTGYGVPCSLWQSRTTGLKDDVSDHLDAGHSLDDLVPLDPPPGRLRYVTLADVEPEPITWLWHHRIARGKIVIFEGDPGLGKSTVTCDLAARISRGWSLPDDPTPPAAPAHVLIVSAEDGIADTIVKRVAAAGADMTRVHVVTEVIGDEGPRTVEIPDDVPHFEELVNNLGVVLVIIDPLFAYVAGSIDTFRDHHMRRALHPFKEMAERTGASVVALRHLNKAGGGKAMYRGGGSIAIGGAARSVLMAGVHPEDDTTNVIAVTKTNLGPKPKAMTYKLVGDLEHDCARIEWGDPVDIDADVLAAGPDVEDRSALDEACELLEDLLADGATSAKEVRAQLVRGAGVSEATLRRAKGKLKVVAIKSNFAGGWLWTLPVSDEGAQPPEGAHTADMNAFDPSEAQKSGVSAGQTEDVHPSDERALEGALSTFVQGHQNGDSDRLLDVPSRRDIERFRR